MKKSRLTESRKKLIEKIVDKRCKALQEGIPLSEQGFWSNLQDVGQGVLGGIGMIPGIGNVADLANAGWSAARGNYGDAALNLAAAVPGAGLAVGAGALANKGKNLYKGVKATGDAAKTVSNVRGGTAAVKGAQNLANPNAGTSTKKNTQTTMNTTKPKNNLSTMKSGGYIPQSQRG